jgi:hypothetical protein
MLLQQGFLFDEVSQETHQMLQTCFGCCLSKSILLAMERVIFLFFAGLIKPRSHRIAAFPSAFLPTLQLFFPPFNYFIKFLFYWYVFLHAQNL